MTTIAAYKGDGWAVIGYDSRVSDEGGGRVYTLPSTLGKVSRRGEFLIGVAGDVRGLNAVAHIFSPPALPQKNVDLDKFITATFIPALKSCFAEHGVGDDKSSGCSLLVAVRGQVFEIGGEFEWCRDERGIYAIGSGGSFALGALYALAKEDMTITAAKRVMKIAVSISTELDAGSGLPVTVISQP